MGLEDFIGFLKNDCNPNGNSKIPKPEEDLVMCDFKQCIERGQYVKCYFDLHKNCEIHKKRKFYERPNDLNF